MARGMPTVDTVTARWASPKARPSVSRRMARTVSA